jgi:NAD-dependent DNA ligase
MVRLTHALSELGAENVGPGLVAKLYAAGFNTVGKIYAATPDELAARVAGCKEKMAQKIYDGLRVKTQEWTETMLMCASCTMPRGIGHTKLHAIFQAEPDYHKWSASMQIPGMKSMEAILAVLPAYTAWKVENQLLASPVAQTVLPTQIQIHPSDQMVVVMTGFRNKELEERLTSKGHVVADTITKKTTHVLYPDGPMHSSTKIQKAQAMNIKVQTVTEFLASL